MTSLILVRHCEAAGQKPSAPLTPAGLLQAQRLADYLSAWPVDAIVASAYRRAQQSAEPLADLLLRGVRVDPRLNECTLSLCPIDNWRQVVRDSFCDPKSRVPGGESANEVLERAWSALNDLLRGTHNLPVVVTHGNLMGLVLHSIDPEFGYTGWENLSNPDVYELRTGEDGTAGFHRLWNPRYAC